METELETAQKRQAVLQTALEKLAEKKKDAEEMAADDKRELELKLRIGAERLFRQKYPHRAEMYR